MDTGSVSLSPYVIAQTLADNEVRKHIAMKVLSDQIKTEAALTAKIVSDAGNAAKKQPTSEHPEQREHKIDVRM